MKPILALLFAIVPALASYAATFRLELDGATVKGGEVCLFEAGAVADPVQRMTAFRQVSCTPSDREVALPRGEWNLFARHRDGYVSQRLLLVRDGEVESGVRTLPLVPSATLRIDKTLGEGETVVAYVEETGHVIPLVRGEDFILVPAGTTVLPVFMSNGVVRSIGRPQTIDAREVASVEGVGLAAAVGLVPDARAFQRIPPRDRESATVSLVQTERPDLRPVNAIDAAFEGKPVIAFFSQSGSIDGRARIAGAGWSDDAVNVSGSRAERPLAVAPTTTLSVHWSLVDDPIRLAEQVRQSPPCPARDRATPRDVQGTEDQGLTLTLARCPGLQAETPAGSIRKETCAAATTAMLDVEEVAGVSVLNDVAPGVYLLRLGYEGLPAIFQVVTIDREDAETEVALQYDRWFGKVTRDGEPLHVKVDLGNGAVSDPDTGEYFAISAPRPAAPQELAHRWLEPPPPVHLAGCTSNQRWFFVPDEMPLPNARFDLEIADNAVEVSVVDSKDNTKIKDAMVVYSGYRKSAPKRLLFGGRVGMTNADGSLSISDVPPDVEMEICASHDTYERKCAERFTMKALRSRAVTIALDPVVLRHGRVLHPNAVAGRIEWFTASGERSERAPIAPDGAFTYKAPHPANEIVAVVAPNTPLLVLRQPALRNGEVLEVTYPAAPVKTYTVTLLPDAKETKGFVTLSVGDIVVPLNVLSDHLAEHHLRPLFQSPGSIVVHDIVAHGAVAFRFAPMSWAEIHGAGASRDIFHLPAAVSLPRLAPGPDGNVFIGGD